MEEKRPKRNYERDILFVDARRIKEMTKLDVNIAYKDTLPYVGNEFACDVYVLRKDGHYGLFTTDYNPMEKHYYGEPDPFPYDDIRLCLLDSRFECFAGFIAVKQDGFWHALYIKDIGWFSMTDDCGTADGAIDELRYNIFSQLPFKWLTFNEYMKQINR